MFGAAYGSPEVIRTLLSAGVRINDRDGDGGDGAGASGGNALDCRPLRRTGGRPALSEGESVRRFACTNLSGSLS